MPPLNQKIKRPPRKGVATQRARAASFKEQSRGAAVDLNDPTPFANMTDKREFEKYDIAAQDDIRVSLSLPDVQERRASTHASGAELVLLGRLVKDGWEYGDEVVWQGKKIPGINPFNHPDFVSDLWLGRYREVYIFVDGDRFHKATLVQMVHDWNRNNRAAQGTHHPFVLPAEMCLIEEQMLAYLDEYGVLN